MASPAGSSRRRTPARRSWAHPSEGSGDSEQPLARIVGGRDVTPPTLRAPRLVGHLLAARTGRHGPRDRRGDRGRRHPRAGRAARSGGHRDARPGSRRAAASRRHRTRCGVPRRGQGDPVGLGGPREFNTEALEAGEAVVVEGVGLGLVPQRTGAAVVWTARPARRRQLPDVGEADRALRAALIATADALAALEVARWRPEVADQLLDLRHREALVAPDGVPPRCVSSPRAGSRPPASWRWHGRTTAARSPRSRPRSGGPHCCRWTAPRGPP